MGLPFVEQPTRTYEKVQVGNAEIGVLEFEKRKSLLWIEKKFIKEQNLFNHNVAIAKLAQEVSRTHGSHFAYTNDRITCYIFGGVIEHDTVKIVSNDKALKSVNGEVGEVTRITYDEETYEIKCITVKIASKEVDVKLDQIELIDPDWYGACYPDIKAITDEFLASLERKKIVWATALIRTRQSGCTEWLIEQTENPNEIDPQLIEEIAQFAFKEENGWKESKPVQPKPSTEEELGNSSTEVAA
jgi:hypothetical protein